MPLDPLKLAKEALDKAVDTEKRNRQLLASIGPAVIEALKPILEAIRDAVSEIKVTVEPRIEVNPEVKIPAIRVPDVIVPDIEVPEPKVTVNVPEIKIPRIEFPKEKLPIEGWVQLMGVSLQNPLPVQLRDKDGKPVSLIENMTQIINASGGGGAKIIKISDIRSSTTSLIDQTENAVRVLSVGGSTGLTDSELRASHLDIQQLSGSIDSVNVLQIAGDAPAKGTELNAGFLRTFLAQDAAYSVRAIANSGVNIGGVDVLSVAAGDNNIGDMDVRQVSGAVDSVVVNDVLVSVGVNQVSGANWSVVATATALDIRSLVNATDSVSAYQVSGHRWSTEATQSGTWNVTVNGATATVAVVGDKASGVADDEANPIKIGGIARTANPTAVTAGSRVSATFDKLGRQVIWPYQVRDLIATARASLTTGTETTLLAGVAGVFHDLVWIKGSNSSSAAVTIDIRDATAGGIVMTIDIPANSVAGVAGPVPYPQNATADTWTADMGDVTGTTVQVDALFVKNV